MARNMVDSLLHGIGEIPDNWELRKIKKIFSIGRGRVIAKTELKENGTYPVYSSQTKRNGLLGFIDTYDYDKPQLTWTTDGANAGTVFLRTGEYNCTNVCGTLLPKSDTNDLVFLKYALEHVAIYHKRADINGYKIMSNEMANIEIPLPQKEEQHKIVEFLNKKISLIDFILENTRKSIAELKKYKQSLITQSVTKGINSDAILKNSNIGYIGNIPQSWSTLKLRYLGSLQNGISKPGDSFGTGYPFLSYGDVYRNLVLPKNVNGLVESTEAERENYSVKCGDVLFTRTSETIEEIGIASTCTETIRDAVFAGFVIRFRPSGKELYPGFSKYYFRSEVHRKFFVKEMNLVTRASLSQELLKRLPVLLPPFSEQVEISTYLDEKCAHIDSLIEQKQQLLVEFEAYKKSFIYEYVTGKKEVL